MTRVRSVILLALVLVALVPATATAAVVREYQLQYSPVGEPDGALMIVSALVDPQESLPATVSIPVPAGSQVLWAGEVLGGDPSQDPARQTTLQQVDGVDVYTLTIEKAYTGQLEIKLPAAKISGRKVSSSVSWKNPGGEVLVTGAVVAEAGAGAVKVTPEAAGEVQRNDAGESLYPLTGLRVKKGDAYTITVEWQRQKSSGGSSTSLMPYLVGALVVAVLVLVAVVMRERTRARRAAVRE